MSDPNIQPKPPENDSLGDIQEIGKPDEIQPTDGYYRATVHDGQVVLDSSADEVLYNLETEDGVRKQTVAEQLGNDVPDELFVESLLGIDRQFYTRQNVLDIKFRRPKLTLLIYTLTYIGSLTVTTPLYGLAVGLLGGLLTQVILNLGERRYDYTCVLDTTEPAGSGTTDDPYLIEDVHQLYGISSSQSYKLTTDIDASPLQEPLATYDDEFTGSLDGNGYSIRNLTLDKPEANGVALFGYTDGATIQNLGIEDAWVHGQSMVGTLVGKAVDTEVTNTYATGEVHGNANTGGLVGINEGRVTNSIGAVEVNCDDRVGGVVGNNQGHTRRVYSDSERSRPDECDYVEPEDMRGSTATESLDLDFDNVWNPTNDIPKLKRPNDTHPNLPVKK